MKYQLAVRSSVELSTANIQYSSVCGRIIAYQFATVDGFRTASFDSTYVDGVSLTHGSPRQHIWTFAAGNRFCAGCREGRRQDSVADDFFCDSVIIKELMPRSLSMVTTLYGMGLDAQLIIDAALLMILTSSRHYHSPQLMILR